MKIVNLTVSGYSLSIKLRLLTLNVRGANNREKRKVIESLI